MHDTLLQIQNSGTAIRRPLKVQFIGEEGVDEGGVQKVHILLSPMSEIGSCMRAWMHCQHVEGNIAIL